MIRLDRPVEKCRQMFRIRNDLIRCALAELVGTTIFVVFFYLLEVVTNTITT